MLTIGELARATGANISTIRHYERVGLLSPPERSDGNQRRYREEDRIRLSFITRSRDLGLSIDAIRDMLQLGQRPAMSATDADRIIDEQLSAIRTKITRLRKLETELERLSKREAGDGDGYDGVVAVLARDEADPSPAIHGGGT
ncbi:MAG: MerR family transcriptional regulator [Hydrogenophaga sp.]|uniref:MerR family transcriptional regulator n=1 Tax=Ciceribacter sp. T2.26MG-112.2 TaxID=3137154 RepID=UPI0012B69F48|nr:MerR family transcriptional regulator [Ciceribacter naphthalenivorans]MBW8298709.1 MerR family transcriptional regulator [Hydrogenophaga sp.]